MKISTKWIVLTSLVFGALTTLVACGGEGGRRIGGKRCADSYNPVDMKAKNAKVKVDAKTADFSQLPAGTYKYAGAQLFYTDKAAHAKIAIADVRKGSANGSAEKESTEFESKISCVRNYLKLQSGGTLNVAASGVSDLVIDENHAVTSFEVKNYGFKMEHGRRTDQFKKADSKPGSFKEVYSTSADEAFLIKINSTRYQIRSYYPGLKDRGDIYLVTYLDYSKPAP